MAVFLSLRHLPVPSVPHRRRLQVFTAASAQAPNFYHVRAARHAPASSTSRKGQDQGNSVLLASTTQPQVVASYGYLDAIDLGPPFLARLLAAVLARLSAVALAADASGGHGAAEDAGCVWLVWLVGLCVRG